MFLEVTDIRDVAEATGLGDDFLDTMDARPAEVRSRLKALAVRHD
jgi:hypothetical protein